MTTHLMSDDLLDACGTAEHGNGLSLAPSTTPEQITCPECKLLAAIELHQLREADHAEALAENEAHDAAAAMAQELTVDMLTRYADVRPAMPQRLRTQLAHRRHQLIVPPRRLA